MQAFPLTVAAKPFTEPKNVQVPLVHKLGVFGGKVHDLSARENSAALSIPAAESI